MTLDPSIVNDDLLKTNQRLRAELDGTKKELDRLKLTLINGHLFTNDEVERSFLSVDLKIFSESQRCGVTGEDGEKIERHDIWNAFHRALMNTAANRELHCGPLPKRARKQCP